MASFAFRKVVRREKKKEITRSPSSELFEKTWTFLPDNQKRYCHFVFTFMTEITSYTAKHAETDNSHSASINISQYVWLEGNWIGSKSVNQNKWLNYIYVTFSVHYIFSKKVKVCRCGPHKVLILPHVFLTEDLVLQIKKEKKNTPQINL